MADQPSGQADAAATRGNSLMSSAENRQMFDRIARRYDLLNRLISLWQDGRWRRRAVAELQPVEGGRYLDVGCGTGDATIEVLRQCPRATIVGMDPAENMLALARAKADRLGLEAAISFEAGDAANMSFPNRSFDGAITAFCIRNLTDRLDALTEMRRVLRDGSRLVILELTTPSNGMVRLGHWLYCRSVVPAAGRLIAGSGDAYRYLIKSVEAFPRPERLAELIGQAGFCDVRSVGLCGGVVSVFVARAR